MDANMLKQYARFVVRTGLNVQKGQTLIINCPIECDIFGRLCAEEGYAAGAKDVVMHYNDEKLARLRMENAAVEVLEDVKPWRVASYMDYVADGPQDACRLAIVGEDPEIFKGLDLEKIDRARQAQSRALKQWRELSMANRMQWCVVSVPTAAWAMKVFPGEAAETAVEKLWEAIFKVCRVDGGDPVAAWEKLCADARSHLQQLNEMDLDALHLQSANGTDLMVGLADDYAFAGIQEERVPDGVPFLANIPSEEVFTAPHCRRVDGVVKASLPYVYNGNVITGIEVRFEKGLAVEWKAESGGEMLDKMLGVDEGARRLGEIALVPASSPIRQTGLLFYNTLFDENAACHMAFGAAYPSSVKGGAEMSQEQRDAKGLNDSITHEDVMIGTADMDITGIRKNGEKVAIFKAGEWAI